MLRAPSCRRRILGTSSVSPGHLTGYFLNFVYIQFYIIRWSWRHTIQSNTNSRFRNLSPPSFSLPTYLPTLPLPPHRHLSRTKIPLTVTTPLQHHLIPPHTLINPQTLLPETPFTHRGHGVVPVPVPVPLTHNIHEFRRRLDVRLHLVAGVRPLLVRVRVPDETGFAPGCAEKAEAEAVF